MQKKYNKLFTDIKAVDQAIADNRTALRISSVLEHLKHDMISLMASLQNVAKMARDELEEPNKSNT